MRRAAVLLALFAAPAAASLYQPDAPAALPVNPGGAPVALPFDEFKRRLSVFTNEMNPELPTDDRKAAEARAAKLRAAPNRTPFDDAALAADLLRLGKTDDALNLLKPRTRDRSPNYYVFATLAHVHAARGEWAEAVTHLQAARLDCEPPAAAKGLTKDQIDWQVKLDAEYVLPLLRSRGAEAAARPDPEAEDVPPIFPRRDRKNPVPPVRFVNDAGEYEPGVLAAAERAKLPPDAVAVVQQLLLWFPENARLYWLLAELYAAGGNLEEAAKIFDECAGPRQYGNRKVMMDHRAAAKAELERREQAEVERQRKNLPIDLPTVYLYFGAVAGLAGLVVVVKVVKWMRK